MERLWGVLKYGDYEGVDSVLLVLRRVRTDVFIHLWYVCAHCRLRMVWRGYIRVSATLTAKSVGYVLRSVGYSVYVRYPT